LSVVDDPHRKICTAVSMAVASIAQYDWPEDWPDLLPILLKMIIDQNNMDAGTSLRAHAYSGHHKMI
jgi:importin-9